MADLAEVRRRLEAAVAACPTSGWVTDHVGIYAVKDDVEDSIMIASVYADGGLDRDDHLRHAEMIEAASPDNIRLLLDALTSLEEENARLREGETWQPIETAPKTGEWIDLWRPPRTDGVWWQSRVSARWYDFGDGEAAWCWPDVDYDALADPADADEALDRGDAYEATTGFTHWRPLPTPPRTAGETR